MGIQAQHIRYPLAAFAVILSTALVLAIGAGTAWAGPGDIKGFTGKQYLSYVKSGDMMHYSYPNGTKKITNAKSSNTKVATVKILKQGKYTTLRVIMKKAGKTKITYKLGGKKKSATLYVKKYKNPVKQFKVGSTDYASKFDKARYAYSDTKLKGVVKITPAAGWKLKGDKFGVYSYNKNKRVKSGYNLKSDWYLGDIILVNKKTGMEEYLGLYSY